MTRLIRPGLAGGISRRGILKGSAALGAAAMLAPFGAGRALAQSTPKPGGTLRIGIAAGNTSDTVDPAVAEHVYVHMLLHAYNAYLTVVMPDGSLEGEVAEGWESTPDAKTWTFRLRPGVLAHDLPAITRGLVPELQRRGAFRRAYEASSLRGLLGLPRPANRYAAGSPVPAATASPAA